MYCSVCNLEYPEQLKFCKQCGRALLQDVPSSVTSVNCCTRCGARVVPHENFCQQCGARTRSRIEDTTIGACTRCGIHWRSAWLFCRNCGLDRDNALGFGSQIPPPLEVVPTVTSMEAVRLPKAVDVQPGDVPDIPHSNDRQSTDALHVVDAEGYVPTLETPIPLGE